MIKSNKEILFEIASQIRKVFAIHYYERQGIQVYINDERNEIRIVNHDLDYTTAFNCSEYINIIRKKNNGILQLSEIIIKQYVLDITAFIGTNNAN